MSETEPEYGISYMAMPEAGLRGSEMKTELAKIRLQVATAAMEGLLSNTLGLNIAGQGVDKTPENVAIAAVGYADALIAELEKTETHAEYSD